MLLLSNTVFSHFFDFDGFISSHTGKEITDRPQAHLDMILLYQR